MLRKILFFWFFVTGRASVFRFLESTLRLGSRGELLASKLLFDQGIWVLLSGANTTALQASGCYLLPYWLERQWNPKLNSFVPTGAGLLTANLTHRNWTSLGIPGEAMEVMVDPVGMITPRADGASFLPILRVENDCLLAPREVLPQQNLHRDGQCVTTVYRVVNGVQLRSEVSAIIWHGIVSALVILRAENITDNALSVTLGIALRPYNTLAVGHVTSVERVNVDTVLIDGAVGICSVAEPKRFVAASRNHADPMLSGEGFELVIGGKLSSESGLLFLNVENELHLNGNKSCEFIYVLPTGNGSISSRKLLTQKLTQQEVFLLQDAARARLVEYASQRTDVSIPDANIQSVYDRAVCYFSAFDDGEGFSPGTYLYHHSWLRDGYFIMQGALNAGLLLGLRSKFEILVERQSWSGLFRNAPNEWDGNGQAMSILVEYSRKCGDRAFLERSFPAIKRGALWIVRQQKKGMRRGLPHSGLLPMGFSAEHLGTIDSYFWDAFWSLHGLRNALWAAQFLKRSDDVHELLNWERSFTAALRACIQIHLKNCGMDVLSASPSRRPDSASIGCIAALDPLELDDIAESWLMPTVEFLLREYLQEGLFFHKIFHTGLNPYLSVQLARVLLNKGDKRWFDILLSLVRSASPTATWPEAINPLTGGGCMGDGHHGWSNAEFVTLLRNSLVLERGNSVYLGHGIPMEWFAAEGGVAVANALSRIGTIDFRAKYRSGCFQIEWALKPNALTPVSKEVFVSLPFEPRNFDFARIGERCLVRVEEQGKIDFKI